jgi:hypothetical protein
MTLAARAMALMKDVSGGAETIEIRRFENR